MTRATLLVMLLPACAVVAGLDEFHPGGGQGGGPDDGGGGSGGAAPGGSGGTGAGGAACATDLLITEVRTAGPAGGEDELVELFNPTGAPIGLSTIRIVGKPLASMNFNDKWTGIDAAVGPNERVVIGGPKYSEGVLETGFSLSQSFSNDQVIAVVRVDGASSAELDSLAVCCADACLEYPDATPNPACGVPTGDPVPSLHREPACHDGVLVEGPPTPFGPPP